MDRSENRWGTRAITDAEQIDWIHREVRGAAFNRSLATIPPDALVAFTLLTLKHDPDFLTRERVDQARVSFTPQEKQVLSILLQHPEWRNKEIAAASLITAHVIKDIFHSLFVKASSTQPDKQIKNRTSLFRWISENPDYVS